MKPSGFQKTEAFGFIGLSRRIVHRGRIRQVARSLWGFLEQNLRSQKLEQYQIFNSPALAYWQDRPEELQQGLNLLRVVDQQFYESR